VTALAHPTALPASRPRPRWGRITHTGGRYGSSETQLVVYPPGSSSVDRFRADVEHAALPVVTGIGIVSAVVLLGVGVPAGPALIIPLALAAAVCVVLRMRTADIRRRSAVLLACGSELCPRPEDAVLQSRVEELAERLGEAARACVDDPMRTDAYDRTWRAVFAEARALDPRHGAPGAHGGR
jgi:hypothetical protein